MSSSEQKLMLLAKAPWLEQIAGSGSGRVFEINDERVRIGRSDENEIVIPNESISRTHAVIERGADGAHVIFDNQSRNGVLVNGVKVDAMALNPGDVIQVGNVAFRFGLPEQEGKGLASRSQPDSDDPLLAAPKKAPNRRVLIYAGVALLVAGLYLTSQSPAPNGEDAAQEEAGKPPTGKVKIQVTPSPDIPDGKNLETIPGLEDPTRDPVQRQMEQLPWSDSSIPESESYFRKGQREFFNKNYHRAIDNFQLALSINKAHPAALYYLQSALHASESLAQTHYEMGVKYFESLQYQRSVYHFGQVIDLLAHRPKDPAVREATKYISLAKQRLQAAELFP